MTRFQFLGVFFLACMVIMVPLGCTSDVNVVHSNCEGSANRTEARVAIEGMMCEIACVAKVKKELLKLCGVAEVLVNFDIHQPVDTAYVSFDPNKVEAADMVATIEAIGNGLYKVHNVEVVHFAPSAE